MKIREVIDKLDSIEKEFPNSKVRFCLWGAPYPRFLEITDVDHKDGDVDVDLDDIH